jgi:hypothetical protein
MSRYLRAFQRLPDARRETAAVFARELENKMEPTFMTAFSHKNGEGG